MEPLIWKYIDGHCNEEEVVQLQHQLETDAAFKELYDESIALHKQLEQSASLRMSDSFKLNLVDAISKQTSPLSFQNTEMMPKSWIVSLLMIAVGMIIFSLKYLGQDSQFIDASSIIDEQSIKMATYSLVGFIVLLIMDKLYKTPFSKV